MNDPGKQSRSIRSFVRREGRLTKAQKFALNNYWDKYGIDYDPSLLDFEKLFQRRAPVIIDIGVGTGESTLQHARQHPENNYLAIEVHRPGIGQLLNKIEIELLHNVKIIQHDVIEVLKNQIPNQCITQFFIFFPDPWPKKRHHKRRLINKELMNLIKHKLVRHGRLHIATDWENYAEHILELFSNNNDYYNLAGDSNCCPRPNWRVETRYESRGYKLKHQVWNFCYGLAGNLAEIKSSKESIEANSLLS